MATYADIASRPDRPLYDGYGWSDLATAIIEQACYDYGLAIITENCHQRRSIERFFRSKYFSTLSYIQPEWLIKNLRKTYEKQKAEGRKRPRKASCYS